MTPIELTKLDFVVDLLATTTGDIQEIITDQTEEETKQKKEKKFTPVAFNKEVANNIQIYLGRDLKKTSRTLYATPDKLISVRCLVSKSHATTDKTYYWYAFHPHFKKDIETFTDPYVAFGCGAPDKILLYKMKDFIVLLDQLNMTTTQDRSYWHVHFYEINDGTIYLHRKGGKPALKVADKRLKLSGK